MRVTHRQIEAFRALMLTGSMTEAARVLSVTQPAVSKIITQLEAELGFGLFERRQGKLEPTAEAYILNAEVKQSYSGLERVMRAARRIKNRTGGSLRIAVLPTLATGFIVQVVQQLFGQGHDLHLSIQAYGSEEIADLVASGLYDLGFAMTPIDTSRVQIGPVLSVPSFCILPAGHRLAHHEQISVIDLDGENFIATAEGTTSRLRTDALFTSMNVTRNVLIEARWSMTISELVLAGLGCSVVDGFTAASFARLGGTVRPLKERLDFTFAYVTPQMSAKPSVLKQFLEAFNLEFERFRSDLLNGGLDAR
ncbi:LysR substrate-binding domain-containing protein [Rhizobium nepotum]|uniref:LysR substrate-binding domain-containing protein n=1 Tax=Rhizobium nepotum TaxID=1035271 RepID=UPI0005D44813|nr:LysR substrate-binding domain-containing protein [Rhizobium nepotum]